MLIFDRIMFNLGTVHLVVFILLLVYHPFNDKVALISPKKLRNHNHRSSKNGTTNHL
jgi:hypothetical protein